MNSDKPEQEFQRERRNKSVRLSGSDYQYFHYRQQIVDIRKLSAYTRQDRHVNPVDRDV
jgi:hypothetical protein